MSEYILTNVSQQTGFITLQRAAALNSLSLEMVRALTSALLAWRDDPNIAAVVIQSSSEKAFCAGGDIRFFYQKGISTVADGSALIEDFFNEEYALNHLIHHYPKPFIALLDGVVMGGGMGIAQAGPAARIRIVTERTKMAMPEVAIGLFPDVGGSYFLSRAPGEIGTYLGVTGQTIGAADAIYAGLADLFVPSAELPALHALLAATPGKDLRAAVTAAAVANDIAQCPLALSRAAIDTHFAHDSVAEIMQSLATDSSEFASKTLAAMQKRSPLMMCVTLAQIRRGASLSVGDCLRMERTMVRRCFEHGEVIEGVRALVIDKDHAPRWNPPQLEQVTSHMVEAFFASAWPAYAHPLRSLS
jgi:enoyl-CoA hydratase/carnithine racemase